MTLTEMIRRRRELCHCVRAILIYPGAIAHDTQEYRAEISKLTKAINQKRGKQ